MTPLTERQSRAFWSRVEKTETCWLWIGSVRPNGYGQSPFLLDGRNISAHRVSYQLAKGDIPEGLQIDHLCRTRHCVNPDHLEAVTPRENQMRSTSVAAQNAAKTHCVHGHEFTEENTIRTPRQRKCRECRRRIMRANYAKNYKKKGQAA